ncbi:hypothetical protein RAA17_12875 [Komagataeibacter rhaeticus]|nr:hypothetical protein [Komagataeibacter rhaeticus]
MLVIVGLTLFYTMAGGLRAVVWSDALQLAVYAAGALACVALLRTIRPRTSRFTCCAIPAGSICSTGPPCIFSIPTRPVPP